MADEPTAPEHIPYKITHQEKTSVLTPYNLFQEVWRVHYEWGKGQHSYIEVPVTEYTPAEVDQKIQEELESANGVQNLGPEPHPDNLAT